MSEREVEVLRVVRVLAELFTSRSASSGRGKGEKNAPLPSSKQMEEVLESVGTGPDGTAWSECLF